jgi:hypothetical protein
MAAHRMREGIVSASRFVHIGSMVDEPIATPRAGVDAAPVPHSAWSAARRDILEAFAAGEKLVVLIGASGTGKSLLLRDIEEALRSPVFHVERVEGGAWQDKDTAPQVLLVDDADLMDDTTLRQVAQRAAGFTVLVGPPGLSNRLAPVPHHVVGLGMLRPSDISAYIAMRLARAGLDRTRLASGTVAALTEAAGGIPGRLNLLLGTSFLVADMAGSSEVRPEHVRDAATLRTGGAGEPADPSLSSLFEEEEGEDPAPLPRAGHPAPQPIPSEAQLAEPPPEAPVGRGRHLLSAAAAVLVIGTALVWLAFPGPRGVPGPDRPAMRRADPPPMTASATPALSELTGEAASAQPPTVAAPQEQAEAETSEDDAETRRARSGVLPSGAMIRVVITYPRGTAEAAQRAASLAAGLSEAGLAVGVPFPIGRQAAGPELNYFFREDREAALQVGVIGAGQLGQTEPRLGRMGGALPRPGTIEVGLPATTAPEDRAAPAPAPATESEPPAPAAALPTDPPNGAVLSLEAARPGVTLSWTSPEPRPDLFVEVVSVGIEGPAKEVFAAYAEAPDRQIIRFTEPGLYAWRVLTVSRTARRYTASPWQHIMIREAPT